MDAILNTNIVDGLSAISKYPIIAAVINSGIKFGIIEIARTGKISLTRDSRINTEFLKEFELENTL